jgi:hypothetical protein
MLKDVIILGRTLCLRVGRVFQHGKHDFEGLNGFIIALRAMKRYML